MFLTCTRGYDLSWCRTRWWDDLSWARKKDAYVFNSTSSLITNYSSSACRLRRKVLRACMVDSSRPTVDLAQLAARRYSLSSMHVLSQHDRVNQSALLLLLLLLLSATSRVTGDESFRARTASPADDPGCPVVDQLCRGFGVVVDQ